MLNTEFSPWPDYSSDEAEAVARVLNSNRVNYWTGEEGRLFESEFAKWAGVKYAVAVNNGSVALEMALRCLGVGPGDEVIVSSRTFLASASSIVLVGAEPVFADIDRNTQNLTGSSVQEVLTSRTKAIICVHLAGMPCDMDPILEIAREKGLGIIEDCAQAHGARYKGKSVGSIGDIGAWSFCQDKIMTTGGEGGMVTTNNKQLWSDLWSYKDHGKSWDAVYQRHHAPGYKWLHESIGTNARMTEMQAVLGRIQLKKVDNWVELRRKNSEVIWQAARQAPGLRAPIVPEWAYHSGYKCYVFVEPTMLEQGWNRDRILQEIVGQGVPCYTGSCSEVYLEKAFAKGNWQPKHRLRHAKELGENSLMFLVHPTITDDELKKTCGVMLDVMSQAGKRESAA